MSATLSDADMLMRAMSLTNSGVVWITLDLANDIVRRAQTEQRPLTDGEWAELRDLIDDAHRCVHRPKDERASR